MADLFTLVRDFLFPPTLSSTSGQRVGAEPKLSLKFPLTYRLEQFVPGIGGGWSPVHQWLSDLGKVCTFVGTWSEKHRPKGGFQPDSWGPTARIAIRDPATNTTGVVKGPKQLSLLAEQIGQEGCAPFFTVPSIDIDRHEFLSGAEQSSVGAGYKPAAIGHPMYRIEQFTPGVVGGWFHVTEWIAPAFVCSWVDFLKKKYYSPTILNPPSWGPTVRIRLLEFGDHESGGQISVWRGPVPLSQLFCEGIEDPYSAPGI